jgi:hypothetical protein
MKTIQQHIEEFERQMPLMTARGKLLCATASPSTYKKIKEWLNQAFQERECMAREDELKNLKRRIEYDMRKEADPSEIIYDLLDTIDLKLNHSYENNRKSN